MADLILILRVGAKRLDALRAVGSFRTMFVLGRRRFLTTLAVPALSTGGEGSRAVVFAVHADRTSRAVRLLLSAGISPVGARQAWVRSRSADLHLRSWRRFEH